MTQLTVKDGMNPIVVTVGPDHSLREAARRMTARGVGAAVVMDAGSEGPGIVTERDILRSNGRDEDIDEERVRDHLAVDLIYAYPDWPLETAAQKMTAAGVRHVIVLGDTGSPIAILSMRDIVRCWANPGVGRTQRAATTA